MSWNFSSIISNSTPLILMIAMYFLCWTRIWMNTSGVSTTATCLRSSTLMIHVSSNDSVATVGWIVSSLEIKYICLLPPATIFPLIVPYLFYFSDRLNSSVCFF